jgi:hypothetical protein
MVRRSTYETVLGLRGHQLLNTHVRLCRRQWILSEYGVVVVDVRRQCYYYDCTRRISLHADRNESYSAECNVQS